MYAYLCIIKSNENICSTELSHPNFYFFLQFLFYIGCHLQCGCGVTCQLYERTYVSASNLLIGEPTSLLNIELDNVLVLSELRLELKTEREELWIGEKKNYNLGAWWALFMSSNGFSLLFKYSQKEKKQKRRRSTGIELQ